MPPAPLTRLSFLIFLLAAALPAAGLGIYGGANAYRLQSADNSGELPDFSHDLDWMAGVYQDLDFGEHLALRGALQLSSRKSHLDQEGEAREELSLRTLAIPVDLLLRNGRNRGAFVSLGAALHWPREARLCESTRAADETVCVERDILGDLVAQEFTLALGAGFEFSSGFVWARYEMGLENLFNSAATGQDYTSEQISLMLGLRF
jgi:hypothetical protein